MIYALLSKIVASRIYAILWAKSLRMPGLGGPNLGNACILGVSVPASHPLPTSEKEDLSNPPSCFGHILHFWPHLWWLGKA